MFHWNKHIARINAIHQIEPVLHTRRIINLNKILVLRIYNSTTEYDLMKNLHLKYDTSIFIVNDPTIDKEWIYDEESRTIKIKADETFIPGILNKTIKAIEICLELFEFDILVRSNMSTVIDLNLLQDKINDNNNLDYIYGGKVRNLEWIAPSDGITSDVLHKHINKLFFSSGIGTVFSKNICDYIVNNKNLIDTSIIDDVSLSLFCNNKYSPNFNTEWCETVTIDRSACFYRFNTPGNRNADVDNIELQYSLLNKCYNKFGFIIVRHVSDSTSDKYWKECYNKIRKFYPTQKILIIDNGSNYQYISDIKVTNTEIIKSEYPNAGELIGYYYFYKLKPFGKAIILHDSMFFNQKINFDSTQSPVKFLWHFESHMDENIVLVTDFLKLLNRSEELMQTYSNGLWLGSFGSVSVISHEFVTILADKYNMFVLCDYIQDKTTRSAIERVFAVVCFNEYQELLHTNNRSILGDIFDYYGGKHFIMQAYTFDSYIKETRVMPLTKIWCLRK